MQKRHPYQTKHKVRIVTAASLFDGHDASINIMRRILQAAGAEVIHLGHNQAAQDVVNCAIQEDAQAIALTSYQGGHVEYFKYMYDLLQENNCIHIKLFGGGGGVILPQEISDLQTYGITKIYSPDDGRSMGLEGMIGDLIHQADFETGHQIKIDPKRLNQKNPHHIAQAITQIENYSDSKPDWLKSVTKLAKEKPSPILGITGTGGAGKSSMVDEFVRRFLSEYPEKTIAIICVDPSKRKTGGALLGDRIRMNSIFNPRVYMRSMATRQANLALSNHVQDALNVVKAAQYDLIILETSGIGQSDSEIADVADYSLYVMTPEFGAASQLEKIDMLDFADFVAINKFDKRGAQDALRDVRKQYKRNHQLFESDDPTLPIFGTMASHFNDHGMNALFDAIMGKISQNHPQQFKAPHLSSEEGSKQGHIIPPDKTRYLSEISSTVRQYNQWVNEQSVLAEQAYGLKIAQDTLASKIEVKEIKSCEKELKSKLEEENLEILEHWEEKKKRYKDAIFNFSVRDKTLKIQTHTQTLSGTSIPKIALPEYSSWGQILKWSLQENVPGEFPYTAGVFPFKREGEDPTRMFAGEGGPERTNRRFHYVSLGLPAKRLSTAFDSVTLYGFDPDKRPDIYGKIGNAGVSVCCLDDAKKLYSGFDLCDPKTSVSMTINGPAPMITAFFMNAAIDQQCEKYILENKLEKQIKKKIDVLYKGKKRPIYQGELPQGHNRLGLMLLGVTGDQVLDAAIYEKIKAHTLKNVRGTVQADILKEDQAQNTCIFSTEFALKLMGDVQEFFTQNKVQNFYSVSISGYHMAEAGANPITQLAFTLANGFTFVEYYLSRGLPIDSFAPNLSFFFSNGIDAEYAVIGRVARRIWSKAMKLRYQGSERSQKLKYHIQTSGRSLHAQEIGFNDIRTTLQALYALFDNCNSLHTNAYDEAITTPTEESVRRAMAIQMIINHELGLSKNQNPWQGAFIIEELTNIVEEAVLAEFDRLTERGGVLGAMETMYQRTKIQEESLLYESKKHSGDIPIIGVNTFLSAQGSPTIIPDEVIRSTEDEKQNQISTLNNLHQLNAKKTSESIAALRKAAFNNENIFATLLDVSKSLSLGQMTHALFDVGGQYRRNM